MVRRRRHARSDPRGLRAEPDVRRAGARHQRRRPGRAGREARRPPRRRSAMSERGLVVHQGSLSTMETALADATTTITSQIDDLLEQVETLTPGWDETSDSHAANLAYQ